MPTVVHPTTTKTHSKPARRKIPLVAARRGRKQEDDEDEAAGTEESYTDDSGLSEDEGTITDDDSEDDYDDDEPEMVDAVEEQPAPAANGNAKKRITDTEVMTNGIDTTAAAAENADSVDFEDMGAESTNGNGKENGNGNGKTVALEVRGKAPVTAAPVPETAPVSAPAEGEGRGKKTFETPFEKRRREHEEYKKKRAEDPAFVPNRGRFFMHDHRYDGTGSNGFRPYGPGGRGRGGRHGEFQGHPPPPEMATEWPHDMHEQAENQVRQNATASSQQHQQQQQQHQPSANNGGYTGNSFAAGRQRAPDQPRSFGRTIHKGTVQIQVNLPGMQAPITFSEVPWKAYTRLPYHRPPLRRDKPVRIALPEAPIRYIYPSMARSFIFIPRAMRPGGSGYIRGASGRGRGGYPSGRSMYGGGSTVYSPSIGMSRRSSVQYDTRHHTPAQPIHPTGPPPLQTPYTQDSQTRPATNGDEDTGRPIVRLPSAAPSIPNGASSSQSAPKAPTPRNVPQHPPPSYTPSLTSYTPINPVPYREARATPKIPMYQPRPQKTVNVAEIDSPHVQHFPQNYAGGVYTEHIIPSATPHPHPHQHPHSRHPSYPSQPSGTPLSQIPEALHARPFYPPQQPQMHAAYYHPYPHPHAVAMHYPPPPYVAGPYAYPPPPPQPVPAPAPAPASAPAPATGPTTIAQESNGMVYYSTWDPNTFYPSPVPAVTPVPPPDAAHAGAGTQSVGGTVYYYPPPPQGQAQPQQVQGQQGQVQQGQVGPQQVQQVPQQVGQVQQQGGAVYYPQQ
ncbi:CASC3/Barentsz eIF4AIII binding-domain-containing protein [Geopyxis carbonaria]|nr:CASC3/Barentsz eIF4AIII binding-domain-containing protein [Geopyxis carbonaria]